ncbi:hypothetical protein I302_108405 [Kwoniella bestiolae CBS 10118]|uniref:Uncharacterized protein n=1 Tax=Kwoniella bestiolae CBS 10118 TaxID=1296100 RepID=A0A1B9FVS1_9TREE|nr:hypothetical protein I302_07221 [Kwoniella bestiolae CBS 10118]OCF22874.1 hypothetical protein I302_07221 [Kwoniella bestiolae CBS 10118]
MYDKYREFASDNHWHILKTVKAILTGVYPTRPVRSGEGGSEGYKITFTEVFKRYTQVKSKLEVENEVQNHDDPLELECQKFLHYAMDHRDGILVETDEDRRLLAYWRSLESKPEHTLRDSAAFERSKQSFLKDYEQACQEDEAEQERLRIAEREFKRVWQVEQLINSIASLMEKVQGKRCQRGRLASDMVTYFSSSICDSITVLWLSTFDVI